MIITLITDFGSFGPYMGSMKGVMLSINPDLEIVDISHNVSPQNVEEAAFILKNVYSFFPVGTIHVVVVDPGVGTSRSILAVQTDHYTFLAPDNGVLKYIFDENLRTRVFKVANKKLFLKRVSSTFHGRDIFAPVAAHLSKGIPIETVGEPFTEYIRGKVKRPAVEPHRISGEIIYIDRFGNGITNIREDLLGEKKNLQILVQDTLIKNLSTTYSDVPNGEVLALIGSSETLEISVNHGNAKEQLGISVGDPVTVTFDL